MCDRSKSERLRSEDRSLLYMYEGLIGWWGGGGEGSACRLSVKMFDLCRLSVNLS